MVRVSLTTWFVAVSERLQFIAAQRVAFETLFSGNCVLMTKEAITPKTLNVSGLTGGDCDDIIMNLYKFFIYRLIYCI